MTGMTPYVSNSKRGMIAVRRAEAEIPEIVSKIALGHQVMGQKTCRRLVQQEYAVGILSVMGNEHLQGRSRHHDPFQQVFSKGWVR
jgi:hypothetical protein